MLFIYNILLTRTTLLGNCQDPRNQDFLFWKWAKFQIRKEIFLIKLKQSKIFCMTTFLENFQGIYFQRK